MVKILPANSSNARSISGLGGSPGERNGNTFQDSWEIPWTEDPGGLQCMGLQRFGHE